MIEESGGTENKPSAAVRGDDPATPNGGAVLRGVQTATGRFREPETAARPRVLVVDDEAGVRNLLFDVLSDTYDCDRAASGEEAIEKTRASRFHVVLSDIMMPKVSGLDVLK